MSYLTQYAVSRPASVRPARRGARVDERTLLNRPAFDGGAQVRVYVEDTSDRKLRRRRLPSPRLKLRIADCVNEINLEFSVDTAERRENSLYKIETLIAALERFRAGLAAEADLRALRERARATGVAAGRSRPVIRPCRRAGSSPAPERRSGSSAAEQQATHRDRSARHDRSSSSSSRTPKGGARCLT